MLSALVLAGLCLVSASGKGQDRRLAEAWVAAWNSHDPDKVAQLFTDDAS